MTRGTEILGSSEAARRLRVHECTVRRLAENGTLPHTRDSSGKRLFFANDVDKLAREREQNEQAKQ